MNSAQIHKADLVDDQKLKQTSHTFFEQFDYSDVSEINLVSLQNSEIHIKSQSLAQISTLQTMNVYELLEKCDEFISQHAVNKLGNNKGTSLISTKASCLETEPKKSCAQCENHLAKEQDWINQKDQLQQTIRQLENQIIKLDKIAELYKAKICFQQQYKSNKKNISLDYVSEVISVQIKNLNDKDSNHQKFFSPQTVFMTLNQSRQIQNKRLQIASQNQLLLQAIKTFDHKLSSTQQENKYLKIENRALQKTKSEIQSMKREIQKTKSERDSFKKKLISLAQKQSQNKPKCLDILPNDRNSAPGLKQRGPQNKKKQQTLFELSLTEASSKIDVKNRQSLLRKNSNKPQRINFITSSKNDEDSD